MCCILSFILTYFVYPFTGVLKIRKMGFLYFDNAVNVYSNFGTGYQLTHFCFGYQLTHFFRDMLLLQQLDGAQYVFDYRHAFILPVLRRTEGFDQSCTLLSLTYPIVRGSNLEIDVWVVTHSIKTNFSCVACNNCRVLI